ncbi:heme NO-binding protein [Aliigemmobacter aestuarii]|uniref:Heme NO-binding protein n=1 Tax=Aliigemmobacter aestuarii TaxID=1445661 RepID=A0A4S3MRD1_9RHOB|nr:heme NO-binding domain-containing protein [Gemmobacter aestuarii]THD84674.1 heme NO-binding protein [Gemmobacter aestuarii]
MHGLINRAIQNFLRDTYGGSLWVGVVRHAALDFDTFEPMLSYDPALTDRVIGAATALLSRPRETLLEDLGTYLVSHPNVEALRRLLRFGGIGFADFLHSLEELPGRGRLAVPDLDLPALDLSETGPDSFCLRCRSVLPGAGHVMVGLLRAMADDYGALVLLDHEGEEDGAEIIAIRLLARDFAEGRRFDLALARGA